MYILLQKSMHSMFLLCGLLTLGKANAQLEVQSVRANISNYHNEIITSELNISQVPEPRFLTNLFGITSVVVETEIESRYTLWAPIEITVSGAYQYGRDIYLSGNQDYLPNTATLSFSSELTMLRFRNCDLNMSYQWNGEMELIGIQRPEVSGPSLVSFSINYTLNNWLFTLSSHRFSHSAWDGANFEIENQELGEPQDINEALYLPGKRYSFIASVQYNL